MLDADAVMFSTMTTSLKHTTHAAAMLVVMVVVVVVWKHDDAFGAQLRHMMKHVQAGRALSYIFTTHKRV